MAQTIFFSWQSDTPNKVGRNFLKDVLEKVCDNITSHPDLSEASRGFIVDSDTQGVAGQPPIVETIFKKIDASAVFIADMTFVSNRNDGRPSPNPNVLIEYGWALKGLTHQRVICVMNEAYGKPTSENLPFDLSHVRWPIRYNLPEEATPEEKAKTKQKLVRELTEAVGLSIKTTLTSAEIHVEKFPAAESRGGPGRFRGIQESLGIESDFINSSGRQVFLSEGDVMWLRLMPQHRVDKQLTIPNLRNILETPGGSMLPLMNGAGGYSYLRAKDGMGMYRAISESEVRHDGSKVTNSISFIFTTGEIWSSDTYLLNQNKQVLYAGEIENACTQGLIRFSNILDKSGIKGPYKWTAGISGTYNRTLDFPLQRGAIRIGAGPRCLESLIENRGEYAFGQSAKKALLPFFTMIFESCGIERPEHLGTE